MNKLVVLTLLIFLIMQSVIFNGEEGKGIILPSSEQMGQLLFEQPMPEPTEIYRLPQQEPISSQPELTLEMAQRRLTHGRQGKTEILTVTPPPAEAPRAEEERAPSKTPTIILEPISRRAALQTTPKLPQEQPINFYARLSQAFSRLAGYVKFLARPTPADLQNIANGIVSALRLERTVEDMSNDALASGNQSINQAIDMQDRIKTPGETITPQEIDIRRRSLTTNLSRLTQIGSYIEAITKNEQFNEDLKSLRSSLAKYSATAIGEEASRTFVLLDARVNRLTSELLPELNSTIKGLEEQQKALGELTPNV